MLLRSFKSAMGQPFIWLLISLCVFVGCNIKPKLQHATSENIKPAPDSVSYWWSHPYLTKADSFQNNRNFASANWEYQKAAGAFEKEQQWSYFAYCKNAVAFNLMDFGELDSAAQIIKGVVDVEKKYEVQDFGKMGTLFNKGLYASKLGRNDSALFYFSQAQVLNKKADPYEQSLLTAHLNHRTGDVYRYGLFNYRQGEEYYQKALAIREQLLRSSHFDLMVSYYALASLYRVTDDHQRADIFASNALRIAESLPENKVTPLSLCYNLMANIKHEKAKVNTDSADFYEAINYHQKAIDLYDVNSNTNAVLGSYFNNLGAVYRNMIEFNQSDTSTYQREANRYFHKALKIHLFHGNDQGVSDSYLNLGWGHLSAHNIDSATYFYNKCLEIRLREMQDQIPEIAEVYQGLGETFEAIDSFDISLDYYQQALDILIGKEVQEIIQTENIDLEYVQSVFKVLIDQARTLSKRYTHNLNPGDLIEALKIYKIADRINGENRNSNIYDEGKVYLSNYYEADFERAVEACYQLYQIDGDPAYLAQAFDFMEKDKYMLLFESLIKTRLLNEIGIPDSTVRLENDLKTTMGGYQQEMQLVLAKDQRDTQRLEELNINILDVNRRIERLKSQMVNRYPGYYKVQYDTISRNLETIRSSLSTDKTMLLEYFWGENHLYAMALSKNDVTFEKIAVTEKLLEDLQSYLDILNGQKGIQGMIEEYSDYLQSAFGLYQALVEPLISNPEVDQIVVVPDGPLAYVPFESLVTDTLSSDQVDYSKVNYLIRKVRVQYAYSSNLLFHSAVSNEEQPKILAVSHSSLSGSTREIESIQKVFSTNALIDTGASESNFKDQAKDFDILHLAVHGEGDKDNLLNSKLIFNQNEDDQDDGILNNYELYNVDLNAQLAVLSACETGVGRQVGGEGVYSMARAFTYAGCPSVIMSLWKLNDTQSASIFKSFYRNIRLGASSNEALYQAKLDYLETQDEVTSHPSTWAALVSMGESKWPAKSAPIGAGKVASFMVILLLVFALILIRRRSFQQSSK